MAGNQAVWWGLSHLEPPKSQPTLVELKSSQVGVPTCFFIRVFIGQIRCCLCARNGREPCRTMQNHADRWGLSHLALELKSSQVGVPTCFFIRGLIGQDVAYAHGMAGNHAEPCRTTQIGGDFRT